MAGQLIEGDCIVGMRAMSPDSVDAVVTDPPYGLAFMEAAWDKFREPVDFQNFCRRWASEAIRILRPGGFLAAFGAPRTYHRLASGIEDAGFTIRDQLEWLHSQGKPQATGHLKPAHEPIVLAQKSGLGRSLRVAERLIVAAGQPDRQANNVVIDATVAALLDAQSGALKSGSRKRGVRRSIGYHGGSVGDDSPPLFASTGGASRFYYCARVRGSERGGHVAVKPVDLMRWLVGLLAAPGETILDPFMGTGSTAVAAELCGCNWIGFEADASILAYATKRIGTRDRYLPLA